MPQPAWDTPPLDDPRPARLPSGASAARVPFAEDTGKETPNENVPSLGAASGGDAVETALQEAALGGETVGVFLTQAVRILGEAAGAARARITLLDAGGVATTRAAWQEETEPGPAAARLCLPIPDAPEAPPVSFEFERPGERWQPAEREMLEGYVATVGALWQWLHIGACYHMAVASMDDALFSFDFDAERRRRYRFVTPQMERLTGRSMAAFLAATPAETDWTDSLVHPADRARVRAHEEALRAGREGRITYRILRADGTERWLREHGKPERDSWDRLVVSGLLADVTAAHVAEEALREAKRRAEEASALKTTFLALISHELRSPLGAIHGYAHLLSQELAAHESTEAPLPAPLHEFAEAIGFNAEKVLALVSNVVHLSNLEAGEVAVDLQAVPVAGPIGAAVERVRPLLAAKAVALHVEITPALRAWADPDRLEQVLDHLLANAVKFTAQGAVTVRAVREGPHVHIIVADTGVGVNAAGREDLFAPFVQEDRRLNRAFEGAGLGLALVKRFVELMGGRVSVESEKGHGAAFTVRLAAVDVAPASR